LNKTLEQTFQQSLYPTGTGGSKHLMETTKGQSNLMLLWRLSYFEEELDLKRPLPTRAGLWYFLFVALSSPSQLWNQTSLF